MSMRDPAVIVGAARTPMGGFLGDLRDVSAPALGARAISAAIQQADVSPEAVDEALMGCILPAGQWQAPARQASAGARRRRWRSRRETRNNPLRMGHGSSRSRKFGWGSMVRGGIL